MSQSLKAIVQLCFLVAAIAGFGVWVGPKRPDQVIWVFRVSLPIVTVMLGWLLWRDSRRKDVVPDFLGELMRGYFERDGLCFAISLAVENGVCWFNVFFQNRYERGCDARIVMQPPYKTLSMSRLAIDGLDLDLQCDGGAFGVAKIPVAIPREHQGRSITYDVTARTWYPNGRGRLLRFKEGLLVGAAGGEAARTAVTTMLLLVGVIRISKPARATISLPTNVAENVSNIETIREIRWRPDLPTAGFPVQTASGQVKDVKS